MDVRSLQSSYLEQYRCVGFLHAGEVGEGLQLVLCVAAAQHLVAERLSYGRIELSVLLYPKLSDDRLE